MAFIMKSDQDILPVFGNNNSNSGDGGEDIQSAIIMENNDETEPTDYDQQETSNDNNNQEELDDELYVFTTQRGHDACRYRGFTYRLGTKTSRGKRWRCRVLGCNGKLWSSLENTNPEERDAHSHQAIEFRNRRHFLVNNNNDLNEHHQISTPSVVGQFSSISQRRILPRPRETMDDNDQFNLGSTSTSTIGQGNELIINRDPVLARLFGGTTMQQGNLEADSYGVDQIGDVGDQCNAGGNISPNQPTFDPAAYSMVSDPTRSLVKNYRRYYANSNSNSNSFKKRKCIRYGSIRNRQVSPLPTQVVRREHQISTSQLFLLHKRNFADEEKNRNQSMDDGNLDSRENGVRARATQQESRENGDFESEMDAANLEQRQNTIEKAEFILSLMFKQTNGSNLEKFLGDIVERLASIKESMDRNDQESTRRSIGHFVELPYLLNKAVDTYEEGKQKQRTKRLVNDVLKRMTPTSGNNSFRPETENASTSSTNSSGVHEADTNGSSAAATW